MVLDALAKWLEVETFAGSRDAPASWARRRRMRSVVALVIVVASLVAGCGPCGKAPATPVDPADANCTTPRPNPEAKCVQDCGPPVVREGDPPPPWRWLTPEEVAAREQGGCPRCLPPGAAIATPAGDIAVGALVAGTLVWSIDERGHRVAVPVVRVGSVRTPPSHALVVLELSDGRTVAASAGHPTADGRLVGALEPGDSLDGARVVSVGSRAHGGALTFDLLPASPTRAYWADGVLLTSTLR